MTSDPRIEEVETLLIDLPIIRPHRLAMTTMNNQTVVIVRIRTSDGIIGIGEGTTIGGLAYGPESPEGMKLAIDTYITPILLQSDPNRIGPTMGTINKAVQGNNFAKCAVETALVDALGKRNRLTASELLGGRFHDRLPVAWTLASGDTDADIAEAEEMLAKRRHNIFKLKIGRGEGLAGLARETSLAIMADEALRGPETAFQLAQSAAVDVFALKIAQSGGLFATVKVAAIAEAAGIDLYGGTMLEAGVGTAASAHVFATFPKLAWGTELFGPLLLTEEILTEPLDYADFSLGVPTGPGLGVALDEDKIARFRRDRTAPTLHVVAAKGA